MERLPDQYEWDCELAVYVARPASRSVATKSSGSTSRLPGGCWLHAEGMGGRVRVHMSFLGQCAILKVYNPTQQRYLIGLRLYQNSFTATCISSSSNHTVCLSIGSNSTIAIRFVDQNSCIIFAQYMKALQRGTPYKLVNTNTEQDNKMSQLQAAVRLLCSETPEAVGKRMYGAEEFEKCLKDITCLLAEETAS